MKLCTYLKNGEKHPRVGMVVGDEEIVDVIDGYRERLGEEPPHDMIQLLDDWERNHKLLKKLEREYGEEQVVNLSEAKLLAPIPRPRKIVAALVNTKGMLGGELEKELKHPRLFLKAPNTVIGPGETIIAPPHGIRPEIELAAIIGKKIKHASIEEAEDAIIGYTILNDVTAPRESKEDYYYAYRRDPETGEVKKTRMRGPLFRSKNHDTFTPMGPWIVAKEEIGDASELEMKTYFNDELIQRGSTKDYIFTPAEIVRFTTTFLTLEPGDVISCGTVGWIGEVQDPSEQVLPSNEGELRLAIQKIGELRNRVTIEQKPNKSQKGKRELMG